MSKVTKILLAEFDSASSLLHAAEKMRDAGYRKYDCHSPFPIHGMDDAMGLKRSPLGYVVGFAGICGLVGALGFQWWTSAVDYPIVISGKAFFSYQAFVPVTFAITVLLSAFGAFFGMLHFNKLPRLFHPLFNSDKFAKVTDGGFFVSVESDDPKFDAEQTMQLLKSIGAVDVEVIES